MTSSIPNAVAYEYAGNGATSVFSFPLRFLENTDLLVFVDGVQKVYATHYTVTGAGSDVGGSVTFTGGNIPASGTVVRLQRSTLPKQTVDLTDSGKTPGDTLEKQLDRLAMAGQDQSERIADIEELAGDLDDAIAEADAAAAAASASAVAASDSAASALAAKTNAETAETNAETAETNAEAAQAAAELAAANAAAAAAAAVVGVQQRGTVRAATTANITIATALNNGDALDGVTLVTGDKVLVKNQSTASQNGIYVVGVTPVRDAQFDTYSEFPGAIIAVQEGSTNADTMWLCTSNAGGTIDSTAIAFAAVSVTPPDDSITNAKLANMATTTMKGRRTAGTGDPEDLSPAQARDVMAVGVAVATRTALKALDTTLDGVAFLKESGREGTFVWRSGDYSSRIAADTAEGVYVKANAIASASGAWVREAADTPVWLASWFGAVGDDSTDNATAIAAANSAFTGGGGTLIFSTGVFRISSVTITKAIIFQGMGGEGHTVFKATTTTGNMISMTTNYGIGARNIYFDSVSTRTGGAYIYAVSLSRLIFQHLFFTKYYNGIHLEGCTSTVIERCDFRNGTPFATAPGGAAIRYSGAATSTDNRIQSVTMDANPAARPHLGIAAENTDALQISDTDVINHVAGLYMAPGTGQQCAATFVTNSYFDNCDTGILIAPTGTGVVPRATFNGVWASSASDTGIKVATAGGGVNMLQFTGCQVLFCTNRGLQLQVNCDARVVGGQYNQNGGDGILVAPGVTGFSVVGAQIKGNSGNGILLSGSNDNFVIIGNDISGNTTAAINGIVGNTGTKVIHSNLGVPEVVANKQIASVQGSAVALSNSSTAAQNIFAAANDTLTVLAATTYRFRASISLNTGATSHATSFGMGGTATFTSISYTSRATSSAAGTLAAPQMRRVETAAATALTAASTAVTTDIEIEGVVRINAAGTIVPQITFSAGPTGTCEVAVNSFFELEPIGSNTVAAVGNWA